MKAIGIILMALLLLGGIMFLISFFQGQKEEKGEWYLHCAFDYIFWLKALLKKEKPKVHEKVGKKLDSIIDTLLEVEQIMQEDEKEVD